MSIQQLCLGYLDLTVSPPKWICQDPCVTSSNVGGELVVCGSTNHLTNFAVLFQGVGGVCSNSFILGKALYDSMLALGIALLILLICCILLLFSFTPVGRKWIEGEEGRRIRFARRNSRKIMRFTTHKSKSVSEDGTNEEFI